MSKSKGNVVDPLNLMDEYGADALRFTLAAMAAQGRDVKMSEERVEGYRNFATKLWNATRYCEMNGCNPPGAEFNPSNVQHTINRWIIGQVAETKKNLETAIEAYRFNDAANAIYQFVWGTFCDWYVEFTKPLLAEGNPDETTKQETRDTTGWVLDQILLLLNPFMPFITEELYESIAVRETGSFLMTQSWPQYEDKVFNVNAAEEIKWLIRAITEIRSVRSDMNVPPKAMIRLLVQGAAEDTKGRFAAYDEVLRRMARIEAVEFVTDAPKGAVQTVLDETTLILPIADIIDLDKERARLKKEIDRLNSDLEKTNQKLGNDDFMSRASDDVIDEMKQRKVTAETTINKLSQALKHLEAA